MSTEDLELLRGRIAERWPRRQVMLLAETGSTNDVAKEQVRRGGPEALVVLADRQSAGRGRVGRAWHSPSTTGLYLSTVLPAPPGPPTRIPLVCAVALHRAIEPCLAGVGLKWPNDLLAPDGRKLAGILCESVAASVVVGVGVNVAQDSFPTELASAASLRMLGAVVTRSDVALAFLAALDHSLADGWEAVRADWKRRSPLLGSVVRVGDTTGRAVDLADDGALVLEVGHRHVRVSTGELERIAP